MGKISFTKLGVKINNNVDTFLWNELCVEVRQYLPIKEKAAMIGRIINNSAEKNGFYNPLQLKMFLILETVYSYTNINFTEKQKENVDKLYDTIVSSGLFDKILEFIPVKEWNELEETVTHTISKIYEYRNSVIGLLDTITTDYDSTKIDIEAIQQAISNPENLTLLKDIMSQLG